MDIRTYNSSSQKMKVRKIFRDAIKRMMKIIKARNMDPDSVANTVDKLAVDFYAHNDGEDGISQFM